MTRLHEVHVLGMRDGWRLLDRYADAESARHAAIAALGSPLIVRASVIHGDYAGHRPAWAYPPSFEVTP